VAYCLLNIKQLLIKNEVVLKYGRWNPRFLLEKPNESLDSYNSYHSHFMTTKIKRAIITKVKIMSQGILPFQYEVEPVASGMTALAGLPSYLDLSQVCGLTDSIRQHLTICSGKKQSWTDEQIVMSLVLLNLAGGDRYDDRRILEGDEGFAKVMRRVETHGLPRKERRELERRWRKKRRRALPSQSQVFRYLEAFHNNKFEPKREEGKAFIPAQNEHLPS